MQAGSVLSLNMIMMDALARSGTIPLEPELLRETIREKTKQAFVETNLRAFDLGFEGAARVTELSKLPNEPSGNIEGLSAYGLLNRRGAHMKGSHSLDEVDRKILDIISHFGSLTFLDLWDEIGEDATLAEQIMSKEEALRRLELLMAQGYVESVKDSEGITGWALKQQ